MSMVLIGWSGPRATTIAARLRSGVPSGWERIFRRAGLGLVLCLLSVVPAARGDTPSVLRDARLQQPESLSVRAEPLGGLMDQFSHMAGVPLSVAGEIADERVSLFTHAEPLGRSLVAVAGLLDLRWAPARGGYVLERDLATRQRDDALCRQKQAAALSALQEKVRRCAELLRRSPQELKSDLSQRQAEAGLAHRAPAPALRQQLEALAVVQDPLARPCLLLLERLQPGEMQFLLAGRELFLSSAGAPGSRPFPADLLPLFQEYRPRVPEALRDQQTGDADPQAEARVRLSQSPQGDSLECEVGTRDGSAAPRFTGAWLIAAPPPAEPAPAAAPHHEVGLFAAHAQLAPRPSTQRFGRLVVETSGRTIADLAAALAAATGCNVVGDAFTKPDFRAPGGASLSLADYLDAATTSVGYRWDAKGGYVRFRDLTYFCDRNAEVPAHDLRRWQEAVGASGKLSLADMGDICARLTQEQLQTLVFHWPAFFGHHWRARPGPECLFTHRQDLRWYGLLSESQRGWVRAGRALPWQQLLPWQRADLVARLTDSRDPLTLQPRHAGPGQQVDLRPEALARAAYGLRLEQQPVQYYTDAPGQPVQAHLGDPGRILTEDGALGRTMTRAFLSSVTETVATFVYKLPLRSGEDLVVEAPVIASLSGPFEPSPAAIPTAAPAGPSAKIPGSGRTRGDRHGRRGAEAGRS